MVDINTGTTFVLHKCNVMEEKKERSYEKEKFKTEPSGIRFNIKQLPIALHKSNKKTKQQLVDFLIDMFVNGENPVMERQEESKPEIRNYSAPIVQVPKVNQYQAYCLEIKSARSLRDFPAIVASIKADSEVGVQEKITLERLAIEESKSDRFL